MVQGLPLQNLMARPLARKINADGAAIQLDGLQGGILGGVDAQFDAGPGRHIITETHIGKLREYAANLWKDALLLEQLWLEGKLTKYVQIGAEEESIARLAPWRGSPALMASDGLFSFT